MPRGGADERRRGRLGRRVPATQVPRPARSGSLSHPRRPPVPLPQVRREQRCRQDSAQRQGSEEDQAGNRGLPHPERETQNHYSGTVSSLFTNLSLHLR